MNFGIFSIGTLVNHKMPPSMPPANRMNIPHTSTIIQLIPCANHMIATAITIEMARAA